ncbi:hypothetical protein F2Q69_00018968 [Brassica cretica]|uniref:TIR domain-containing protein n=1 Tax=Brassica cretica TaxID=69181 RepID=A0A8S9QAM6_BRACR|nr:hypothetical protein F2Q69_00018968 [Brassica cretica]
MHDALKENEVRVFRDQDIDIGSDLSSTMREAMHDSAAYVVILSPRFADSPLVNPSHVRKQADRLVVDFERYAERFCENEIQRWRGAMNLVGNLSGYVCKDEWYTDDVIGLVVKRVLTELSKTPDEVGEGSDKIRGRSAHREKIRAVLDNVDQIDPLVGDRRWYGEGSLIVITTRDEELLSRLPVNQRYEVKCLTDDMQALKLFSYHSLRKEQPTKRLLDLSKKIVQITGLLPLSIEVVGSLFYDKKERNEWQIQLRKLKQIQPNNLPDLLAFSFKSLNDEGKQVFLDIACLFLGMEITKEDVVDILKGNLSLLPSELKWIQWKGCPLKKLPPGFLPGQLAVLDLSESGIRQVQSLRSKGVVENLKVVNLSGCHSLKAIPDLSNHKAIEKLVLEGCKLLVKVPRSVGHLRTLLHLDLRNCSKLAGFLVDVSGLRHLEKLFLSGCSNLRMLPVNIGAMGCLKELLLDGTAINTCESIIKIKLRLNNCERLDRLPETFGGLKSLHHLYMQETSVAELPESFGNLSKRPVFRSSENDSPGTSAVMPNSFSNLVLLEELDARGCSIRGKIPDDWEKLSSMNILDLGDNCFHSLPSSLEGLSKLKTLSLYDCRELECVPALPWKLEQLNLANCVSLKSISDLSKLEILHDLNLTNCEKLVDDVPGLEHLTSLARLYMCGCNLSCSLAKVPLKMMRNLSLPGKRIPDWFSQGPVTFSVQPNRELRGVIIAVVVALNQESRDNYILHDVLEVIKRDPPIKQGVELKMHGIHLIYEGDDDFKSKEHLMTETQLTVPQKLSNFFGSLEEGEVS